MPQAPENQSNIGDFVPNADGSFEFVVDAPNLVMPAPVSKPIPIPAYVSRPLPKRPIPNRLTTRFNKPANGNLSVKAAIKQQAAQINLRPAGSQVPDQRNRSALQLPPASGNGHPDLAVDPAKVKRRPTPAKDDVAALIYDLQTKVWNKNDSIPQISKRPDATNEMVRRHEILRARMETGDTAEYAADKMGVRLGWASSQARAIVRQELNLDPGGPDPYADKRKKLRERFIEEAYALVFEFIQALRDPEKIKAAPLKDIATSLGIVMDKVLIASGKFEETKIMEFSAIKQMSDETLGDFIRETQGSLEFLAGRNGNSVSSGKLETST